jgi:hypothetical protein
MVYSMTCSSHKGPGAGRMSERVSAQPSCGETPLERRSGAGIAAPFGASAVGTSWAGWSAGEGLYPPSPQPLLLEHGQGRTSSMRRRRAGMAEWGLGAVTPEPVEALMSVG